MSNPLAEMSNDEVLDTYGLAVRRSLDWVGIREARVELLRRLEQPTADNPMNKPLADMRVIDLLYDFRQSDIADTRREILAEVERRITPVRVMPAPKPITQMTTGELRAECDRLDHKMNHANYQRDQIIYEIGSRRLAKETPK